MAQNKFRGLGVALITPFQTDGSIDFDALDRLVEYQIKGRVDFLCIMGTTAETPTLSREEKRLLKERLVERVAGRVPLLMGCGGNNTAAILDELQNEDWKGIDGVLSVCPYYNKPSQEGLYQHFARHSDWPASSRTSWPSRRQAATSRRWTISSRTSLSTST